MAREEGPSLSERPDGCMSRFTTATVSSIGLGAIAGACSVVWNDVPAVYANRSLPALAATGRVMAASAGTFGAVGGLYAGVECAAETFRGKKDYVNGMLGGGAAGIAVGVRVGRVPVGLAAGAALAGMSAIVDSTGGHVQGNGGFDDGATPRKATFPYAQQ